MRKTTIQQPFHAAEKVRFGSYAFALNQPKDSGVIEARCPWEDNAKQSITSGGSGISDFCKGTLARKTACKQGEEDRWRAQRGMRMGFDGGQGIGSPGMGP